MRLSAAQQLRQLGDVGGDAPGLVAGERLASMIDRSPACLTPARQRSLRSRSIALSTAVARWRAPGCRYPSSTSFVMTAKDATRRSKRTTTPPMRHPPTSPAGCLVAFAAKGYRGLGRLEPGLRESLPEPGIAFRNRKYFRTNWPSRATSGPLQILHATSRSTVSGPDSALTTWYSALQLGQRKNGGGFGLGMSTLPRQTKPTQIVAGRA
jgi:hypothetical protein